MSRIYDNLADDAVMIRIRAFELAIDVANCGNRCDLTSLLKMAEKIKSRVNITEGTKE
jgi:hypothetical protein